MSCLLPRLGPAGKMNPCRAAGCSRILRHILEAQRGSYKTATPLKLFNVKTIWNKTGKGTYAIRLDSGKGNYIGTFESVNCQIK
ncbi:hypothetical protein EBA29_01220 [Bacillus velezensis]|nr:hypothetical protein NG74_01220 [Bacillus velezensis]ATD76317.1 hypothetical protein CLI98_03095 [Bacillus velezensis]QAR56252.1 hypothetical protein EBA29_01220 [Bacillus velezensis]QHK03778.1 hypothetical protein C7M18_02675 [Bacillus velezensis]